MPWFEPLQMLVRAAKKKGKELGAGLLSIIALGEGGWWTQLRRCAEGLSDHPYCMACGPFVRWPRARGGAEEEEFGGEGAGDCGGAEGENIGARANHEDISWGENKEAEVQAGCKVGTVAHRLLHCPSKPVQEGREKARDRVRKDLKERPWDPLYWRGVLAVPQGAGPPQFEEHVWREGAVY